MGDISREPLPGGPRTRGPSRKGPAEVIRLDELTVEERMETSDPRPREERDDDPANRAFPSPRMGPAAPLRTEPFGRGLDGAPSGRRFDGGKTDPAGEPPAEPSSDRSLPDEDTVEGGDEPEIAVPEVDDLVAAEDAEAPPPAAEPMLQLELAEDSDDAPPLTDPAEVARVLLAVLLCAREPLSVVRLAEVCNSTQKAVQAGLDELRGELRGRGFPLEVLEVADGVRLSTAPAVFPYLTRLKKLRGPEKLSPAALETLAVIAYRQPVIRAEIEAIRGVKVGPMLRSLLDHKLVKVLGRAEVPGRPLQYGTTQTFLDRFGLRSLKDLPSVQEFRSLG